MLLAFAEGVSSKFAFLSNVGFVRTEATEVMVRYRKGTLELDICREPRSYEIGIQLGYDGQKYSMSEIIRLVDKRLGEEYRDSTAKTQEEVLQALERLVELLKTYGQNELSGDRATFSALKQQRQTWSESYSVKVLASQIRPKANEAFRDGNYKEAAYLYGKIESQLSPSEIKKMAIARERNRRPH